MMTVPHLSDDLQTLLGSTAEEIGQATQLIQRKRAFTASTLAQTFVLGWLQNPEATLDELTSLGAVLGVSVSSQALEKRFTPRCAAFLEKLLVRACQLRLHSPSTPAVFDRFSAVFVLDASVVRLPDALASHWQGYGGTHGPQAAVKLNTGLDLKTGHLQLHLSPAKQHDAASHLQGAELPAGSLRVTDLGYYDLDQLAHYQAQGVSWLTRYKVGTGFHDTSGRPVAVEELLAGTAASEVELSGFLGTERIPCRLLAARVNLETAERRRLKLLEQARRKGKAVSQRRLKLAGWTVLVTNAPELSLQEALELYWMRWQIELLFKLWKDQGKVDEWRSENPWRILCELYAKLLGCLIQHWLCLGAFWGEVRKSLVKATRVIRKAALGLAIGLRDPDVMRHVLETVQRSLSKGCQVNSRRKHPATWQRLQKSLS